MSEINVLFMLKLRLLIVPTAGEYSSWGERWLGIHAKGKKNTEGRNSVRYCQHRKKQSETAFKISKTQACTTGLIVQSRQWVTEKKN